MTEHKEAIVQTPIIRMAATYPTGGPGGAQLSFETYLPQDAPVRDVHLMADKIEAVAQRQLYKGLIASKQSQIEATQRQLEMAIKDLERYKKDLSDTQELHAESGRRGKMGVLADKKQEQIDAVRMNMEVLQSNIQHLEDDIKALQLEIDNAVK